MKRPCGQSMVEFAAGASLLSLLLLGTLAISGYQEVDRRGVTAVREAVWRQGWQQGGDLQGMNEDLHRSLFSDSAVRDPSGAQLLVAEGDLQLQTGRQQPDGVAGLAERAMRAPLLGVDGFLGGAFDLRDQGLRRTSARTRVAPLRAMPAPFDTLDLQLTASFALLDDAWHAAGVAHVRQRAGGLVPTDRLRAFNAIWQPLSIPLRLVEPSLGQLCLGLIEPDRIPEDRLGPGRSPLPQACP